MTQGDRAMAIKGFRSLLARIKTIDDKETKKELQKIVNDILQTHRKAGIFNEKEIKEILGD